MPPSRRALLTTALCAGAALTLGLPLLRPRPAAMPPPGADAALHARERFLSHFNCTQAVLESLMAPGAMPPEAVTRLSTSLAAGMWSGMTCGAVTGAVMALGLRHGRTSDSDTRAAEETAGRVRELMRALSARFGSLECSALLGVDMSTPDGVEEAARRGLYTTRCPALVEAAVREAARIMA